jgi:hypothetical protein
MDWMRRPCHGRVRDGVVLGRSRPPGVFHGPATPRGRKPPTGHGWCGLRAGQLCSSLVRRIELWVSGYQQLFGEFDRKGRHLRSCTSATQPGAPGSMYTGTSRSRSSCQATRRRPLGTNPGRNRQPLTHASNRSASHSLTQLVRTLPYANTCGAPGGLCSGSVGISDNRKTSSGSLERIAGRRVQSWLGASSKSRCAAAARATIISWLSVSSRRHSQFRRSITDRIVTPATARGDAKDVLSTARAA